MGAKVGHEVSDETREKLSAALKGRKVPAEVLVARLGRRATVHTRRKMSASQPHGTKHHAWLDDEDVTYSVLHSRVSRERGRAAETTCVDCGAQGAHWSLSWRGVPLERLRADSVGPNAGRPFSLEMSDYDSRCRSCATSYDYISPFELKSALES